MENIFTTVDIIYKKLHQDYDAVFCVDGDEREGKSTLILHIVEYWNIINKGVCLDEDSKYICFNPNQFAEAISKSKPFDCIVYDEAGDINSRKAMSQFNTMLMRLFMVIGGKNLFVILVLPKVKRLDTYFRNDRVRGFFHVYKRSRVSFFNKQKFRSLIAFNENRQLFNYFAVSPSYQDSFPKYDGVLLETYKERKNKKINSIIDEFMNELNTDQDGVSTRQIKITDSYLIKEMLLRGVKNRDICNTLGCTTQAVSIVKRNILNGVKMRAKASTKTMQKNVLFKSEAKVL